MVSTICHYYLSIRFHQSAEEQKSNLIYYVRMFLRKHELNILSQGYYESATLRPWTGAGIQGRYLATFTESDSDLRWRLGLLRTECGSCSSHSRNSTHLLISMTAAVGKQETSRNTIDGSADDPYKFINFNIRITSNMQPRHQPFLPRILVNKIQYSQQNDCECLSEWVRS